MSQWRPLRVLCVGLQDNFGRVVKTNIECWGHEVTDYPVPMKMEGAGGGAERASVVQGDIILHDLDTTFRAREGERGLVAQRSAREAGRSYLFEAQVLRAHLTIALSSRSVSRSMLEQVEAVALLQKPFEMRHLQRYLSVLQRVLFSEASLSLSKGMGQEKVRVLVVEDDADVAHAIRQCLLYEDGYEVVVAYNGLEALEQWLDWHPECIVTDLIMPWMNGYQVIRCLAVGKQQHLPGFVIMSALTPLEGTEKRSYLEGKSIAYVDKPFHIEHLLSAIKQVCARKIA